MPRFNPGVVTVPGVELVLLGFDLPLTGVDAVDQLPGNLVDHGNSRRLVVHLRLQALKPAEKQTRLDYNIELIL